jgi:hypothetical protein
MSFRYMRTLLFFDLPSITSDDKRHYRKFVKLLKKCGFIMLQESVYSLLSVNQESVNSKIKIIEKQLPPAGSVMVLSVTEKQFANINILLGDCQTDIINTTDRVVIL